MLSCKMEACQVHQPQNECILAYSRSNRGMSNTELQNFIDELGKPKMSDAKVIELYDYYTGRIKSATLMECRKEKLEYLDERYGLD